MGWVEMTMGVFLGSYSLILYVVLPDHGCVAWVKIWNNVQIPNIVRCTKLLKIIPDFERSVWLYFALFSLCTLNSNPFNTGFMTRCRVAVPECDFIFEN